MTDSPDQQALFARILEQGITLPEERKFYFNGVAVATSPADVVIILLRNNQPIATLNASHVTAKTFANNILQNLTKFEDLTGQTVLTLDEIAAKTGKHGDE